jgi:hypothetical protein
LLRVHFSPKNWASIFFLFIMPHFVLSCSNNAYVRLMSLYILQFDSYMKFETVWERFLYVIYLLLESQIIYLLMLLALDYMLRKHFFFLSIVSQLKAAHVFRSSSEQHTGNLSSRNRNGKELVKLTVNYSFQILFFCFCFKKNCFSYFIF